MTKLMAGYTKPICPHCDVEVENFVPCSDDLPSGEVRKVESPISITKLRLFIKRMSEEIGAKCQMCNSPYVKLRLAIKIGLRNEQVEDDF
jgi:hypothetical protein